jgi:hypothetical protein
MRLKSKISYKPEYSEYEQKNNQQIHNPMNGLWYFITYKHLPGWGFQQELQKNLI